MSNCGGLTSAVPWRTRPGRDASRPGLGRPCGSNTAREKPERWASDLAENAVGARPEGLQFGVDAVGQGGSGPRPHEILAGTAVRTLKPFVSFESGARTRKRRWSVRASSARQKASKESDFPPATLKRGRAAFSRLGCIGSTTSPVSSKRLTRTPSGRSIATHSTPSLPSNSHSPWHPMW